MYIGSGRELTNYERFDKFCEGVSITQYNNSAVLGFKRAYSWGWGKIQSRKRLTSYE